MIADTEIPALQTTRIKLRFDPEDAHPIIHRLEEREQSEHGRDGHRHIDLLAERRAT